MTGDGRVRIVEDDGPRSTLRIADRPERTWFGIHEPRVGRHANRYQAVRPLDVESSSRMVLTGSMIRPGKQRLGTLLDRRTV